MTGSTKGVQQLGGGWLICVVGQVCESAREEGWPRLEGSRRRRRQGGIGFPLGGKQFRGWWTEAYARRLLDPPSTGKQTPAMNNQGDHEDLARMHASEGR